MSDLLTSLIAERNELREELLAERELSEQRRRLCGELVQIRNALVAYGGQDVDRAVIDMVRTLIIAHGTGISAALRERARISALESALREAVETLEVANEVVAEERLLDPTEIKENDQQIEQLRAVLEGRPSRWPGDKEDSDG